MNKFFLKVVILTTVNLTILCSAQFRTRDRQTRLESFDEQKFSWGFYLNGNYFDYHLVLRPKYGMNGNQNLVTSKPSYSFGAGLIGKMKIDDSFDFRIEPGLQFVQRELNFDTQTNDQFSEGSITNGPFTTLVLKDSDKLRTVKSTYLDIPVLLEYHGDRWYNSRPYIATGFNYMINLQSNSESTDDNLQGVYRSTTHNFAWTAEMGIQFYFGKFRLTPALRGTFGINNELVTDKETTPPYWTPAISTIQTRAFMLVLKFE